MQWYLSHFALIYERKADFLSIRNTIRKYINKIYKHSTIVYDTIELTKRWCDGSMHSESVQTCVVYVSVIWFDA